MNEAELIALVGTAIVKNWTYIAGAIFAFVSGSIFLCWNVSKSFHKKECELLQKELDNQKERFSQYESIVEQRINLLQSETEYLVKHRASERKEIQPIALGLTFSDFNNKEHFDFFLRSFYKYFDENGGSVNQSVADNLSETLKGSDESSDVDEWAGNDMLAGIIGSDLYSLEPVDDLVCSIEESSTYKNNDVILQDSQHDAIKYVVPNLSHGIQDNHPDRIVFLLEKTESIYSNLKSLRDG